MSVPPAVLRRIMREVSELQNNPPEGIRLQASDEDMLDVTGIIEGPEGTPYAGGFFKVKFKFTEEFPAAPPKCWLGTKIFHPNVSNAGEICVNTLKKDWKSTYGLGHILVTIKCLLIYPNPESALDEEAGKLLLENYESYCDRAKLITSVHATPRVRPVEFDIPVTSSSSSAEASTSTSASPSTSTSKVAIPLPLSTPAPAITPSAVARKSASSISPPQPLKSSPSNMSGGKDVMVSSKDRHPSPSPLGTADANVGGQLGTRIGMGTIGSTPAPGTKAVKRAAAGGITTGAEKRKKALKRL